PVWTCLLRAGRRLVSREGDLGRWDGFAVAATAPTGSARRLAGKNRLADIEAELQAARADVENQRKVVESAKAEVAAASEEETAARSRWRELQREADAARDRHAAAERELSRSAAKRSTLAEAQARIAANREEATASRSEAER